MQIKFLLVVLGVSYLIHLSVNYYYQNSEIKEFSYAALIVNMNKYTDNKLFIKQVNNALADNYISGDEYKAIVERFLDKHDVYVGAKMNKDHSNAKQELILAVK